MLEEFYSLSRIQSPERLGAQPIVMKSNKITIVRTKRKKISLWKLGRFSVKDKRELEKRFKLNLKSIVSHCLQIDVETF